MRDLWSAILQTSAARIFSLLVGVVVLFVTARWIGADGRGTVAAITTWVGLLAMLGSLSLGQVAIHRLGLDRSEERLDAIAGSLLAVVALVTFAGWIIAIGAGSLERGSLLSDFRLPVLIVGFAALPFLILEQYASALLSAIRELRVYNRYLVIGRGAALVLTLVLVGLLDAGVLGVLA